MRKIDDKKDKLVLKLRRKGNTFREISAITGMWLSVVYRRYTRAINELSTDEE